MYFFKKSMMGYFYPPLICLALISVMAGSVFAQQAAQQFDKSARKTTSYPMYILNKAPAEDLITAEDMNNPLGSGRITKGTQIDTGVAAQWKLNKVDISKALIPRNDKFWQDKKYSASEASTLNYPPEGGTVQYEYSVDHNAHVYTKFVRARVRSVTDSNQYYRVGFAINAFAVMARAALLRKLGYYIVSPKYYTNLTLKFSSEDSKKEFLDFAKEEEGFVYIETRDWIVKDDTENHTLTLSSAILEIEDNDQPDWYWGQAPMKGIRDDVLAQFAKSRGFRGALLPFALVDIPESFNRFSPSSCDVRSGVVNMYHPFADSFDNSTFDDLRWATRRLMTLTESDIDDIVTESKVPDCMRRIFRAKLVERIYTMSECMDVKSDFKLARVKLKSISENSCNGQSLPNVVKEGKVTLEKLPGYPMRFAHGDRPSPYNDGDLARFLSIEGLSSGILSALTKLNEKLQILTVEDAAADRKKELMDRLINHIRTKPNEPLYQQVEGWGGPLASFNVAAGRHVATGTYFQSSAPVQLVDNVNVTGSIGAFRTYDGFQFWRPMFTANVAYSRDYTHVRPVTSMKDAMKVSLKDLLVPTKMHSIAKILSKEQKEGELNPVDEFIGALLPGEVFIITESIAAGVTAGVTAPIDILMGLSPFNFVNSISFSTDLTRQNLAQILVSRTEDGIEFHVKNLAPDFDSTPEKRAAKLKWGMTTLGGTFDVNFYLNLVKVRAQKIWQNLHTDHFLIPFTSEEFSKDKEKAKQLRKDLKIALKSVFEDGNYEYLYKAFPFQRYQSDHSLTTKTLSVKLGLFRQAGFSECHEASILYPPSEKFPDLKPEDYEVRLYACKEGRLVGRDLLGFGLDLVAAYLKNEKSDVDISRMPIGNPANMPYGKAYWKVVDTEAELKRPDGKLSMMSMITYTWGGWNLKKAALINLIEDIEKKFDFKDLYPYRLLVTEQLATVDEVQFYRINQGLSLTQTGVEKIRDLMLQPDANEQMVSEPKGFISRIFSKLTRVKFRNGGPRIEKIRAGDKEMYEDILTIIGEGDLAKGRKIYADACRETYASGRNTTPYTGAVKEGISYDCLTPWLGKLISMAHNYPTDRKKQVKWATTVLSTLEDQIPLPLLMKYLEEKSYIFNFSIFGFRKGDEDGDLELFGNGPGQPQTRNDLDIAGGLFKYYCTKTKIPCIQLDITNGGIQ